MFAVGCRRRVSVQMPAGVEDMVGAKLDWIFVLRVCVR